MQYELTEHIITKNSQVHSRDLTLINVQKSYFQLISRKLEISFSCQI